jgi:hypothetical protein
VIISALGIFKMHRSGSNFFQGDFQKTDFLDGIFVGVQGRKLSENSGLPHFDRYR